MRRFVVGSLACVLCIGSIAFAQQPQPSSPIPSSTQNTAKMTNADVIDLAGLGLSDDVIIDKIYAAPATDFDTSIPALRALKAAKVSDPVIRAMINPVSGGPAAPRGTGGNEAIAAAAAAAAAPPPPAGPPPPPPPLFHSTDSRVRIYVTDHPINEVISMARSSSYASGHSDVSANGNGVNAHSSVHAGSSSGGVTNAQSGDDPRTVEIQANLQKNCPAFVMVSNNPDRADYVLIFRRQGGKRSTFFAMGGLAGLALSAASKVDGASIFKLDGDMLYATRQTTVGKSIVDICQHIPPPDNAPPVAPAAVSAPAPATGH